MVTQTTEYAMRAMACLAVRPHRATSVSALSVETGITSTYLAKVLQYLAAADLVDGRRGVGGGYKLAREPSAIRLADVINAIEPIPRITACPLGLGGHAGALCPLHRRMEQATSAAMAVFESVTLRDLVTDAQCPTPLCDPEKPLLQVIVKARSRGKVRAD